MKKTTCKFDWQDGYTRCRRLSRSFDTLAAAEKFSEGKMNSEIYVSKGKYKVEWLKVHNM